MAERVRRPKDKDPLLDRLADEDGSPFSSRYAALTFAAALGFSRSRRSSFDASGEPIRWELFRDAGAAPLVDMLAAVSSDEVEALAPESLEDRILILEEFANGGLEVLAEEIGANPKKTLSEVIQDLVLAEERDGGSTGLDVSRLADEFSS